MRVGVVVYGWDAKGGMERQAAQLAARLAARGARVLVATTVAPRDYGRPVPPDPPGVTAFRIPVTRTPVFELAARSHLARAGGVDVLYGVHYRCGVHAVRIAGASGVPVVVKFAGGGAFGDFAFYARHPDRARDRALLGRAERFVCVSEEIRSEAVADGLPPERCVSIPNGVDLARFAGPRSGTEPVVLYVGRLGAEKNLDVLLRAFAQLVNRLPAARLVLAGTGDREESLRLLARSLAVEGAVAFLGPRDDVDALHRSARAFVLPSASEGLPNALLEALAAGTPAVASDIAGNRAVARHDREALLVPPGDADALARALGRVLEDDALAARLAAAGRDRARDYDLETVATRYEELFRSLVRPGRSLRGGLAGRVAAAAADVAGRVLGGGR